MLNDPDDINLGFVSTGLTKTQVEKAIENALNGEDYIWGTPRY